MNDETLHAFGYLVQELTLRNALQGEKTRDEVIADALQICTLVHTPSTELEETEADTKLVDLLEAYGLHAPAIIDELWPTGNARASVIVPDLG